MLNRIDGVEAFEVRTEEQLKQADGLVIPGGESTTMGLIAEVHHSTQSKPNINKQANTKHKHPQA